MSREAWLVVGAIGVVLAVAALVGAIVLAIRVVRARRMLTELGAGGKFAFYGALVYTIFPVDVLPDPIFLDDMGVLAGALFVLTRMVQKQRATRTGAGLPAPGSVDWPDPRRSAPRPPAPPVSAPPRRRP
ncbi:hypothetical protein [Plantactinospora sp. GCM10030261]|uniref:hypothetical protein n=1 Tax=Plantactinospora sp. GCM10030261 TaxID=3273420 RepID=UPI0036202FED